MTTSTSPTANAVPQFAALDLGSNSFHLIIARLVEGQLQPIFKFKQPVQLAQGLNGRYLSDAAIERGVEALKQCAARLEGFDPENVKVVGTHTLRRAKNRKQFLAAAARVMPYPIEVISGREEARLIYRGVCETIAEKGSELVIDIGGGSSEFAFGKDKKAQFLSSRSVGSLVCSEQFFGDGKLTAKRFEKAVVYVRQQVEPVANGLAGYTIQSVFGTSGTIKAIHQWVVKRAGEQPQGLTLAHLYHCRDELIAAKHLSDLPTDIISEDRKQSIAGGVSVLIGVFEELGIERMLPHDSALREGVLYELAQEVLSHQDVRERTISSLAQRYSVDGAQADRVWRTAYQVYQRAAALWQIDSHDLELLLEGAAKLHEVGLSISASGVQKHSGYILANAYMPGFNAEEQRFLATVVRFFRKKIKPEELPELALFEHSQLLKLMIILRLAVIINSDRQDRELLQDVKVTANGLTLKLTKAARLDSVLQAQLADEAKTLGKLGYRLT
ncbi:exopolyphosphatase [Idiomarina aquatica]|uniref:Exopolyphosphatase n=1 Tax=Idiomarina aquatica TaxID=1327752 RepID=A0AA94EFZ3_9GAMM|nr:exopolyphosphatase [Idiomarina aquatica]RUO45127.1 exopolyphosphatase [Idiomarina aquatica]